MKTYDIRSTCELLYSPSALPRLFPVLTNASYFVVLPNHTVFEWDTSMCGFRGVYHGGGTHP